MEKRMMRIGIGGGIAAGVVILGVFLFRPHGSAAIIVTDVVRQGDLVQTVDVTGSVASLTDIALAFGTSGQVAQVREVGERVRAGEVLATLNAGDASAEVARAQALLDEALAGPSEEEMALYSARVEVAEAALQAAEADLANKEADVSRVASAAAATVLRASLAGEDAQITLAQALREQEIDRAQAGEDAVLSLQGALVTVRSTLANADEVLGRENTLQNDGCQQLLGAQNPSTLSEALLAFDRAADARDRAEASVYALSRTASSEERNIARIFTDAALAGAAQTTRAVAQVLDATIADTQSCSIADLQNTKDVIASARTALQTQIEGVINAFQAYDAIDLASETAVLQARSAQALAVQDFASAQIEEENETAQASAEVVRAQNTVFSRMTDLTAARAERAQGERSPRAIELAALRADLRAATARFAKTTIVAPVDGIVASAALDVGEYASTGATIVTLHAAPGQFHIPVNLPESDVAKVSIGDVARITFDAFGDDRVVAGVVTSIDPAETVIEGVVFYEADIVFSDVVALSGLRSGMSADVTLITEEIPQAFFVPQRAVLEEDGKKYVRLPKGEEGDFEKRIVEVGIRADDGYLEIIHGLQGGEVVITSLKTK